LLPSAIAHSPTAAPVVQVQSKRVFEKSSPIAVSRPGLASGDQRAKSTEGTKPESELSFQSVSTDFAPLDRDFQSRAGSHRSELTFVTFQTSPNARSLEQQARQAYEAGQFSEAVQLWQQVVTAFKTSGDKSGAAMALSNLSLTHQQLGQWQEAEQAIWEAKDLLKTLPNSSLIYAQVLDVQGRSQYTQGQPEAARTTWQQAAAIYTQLNDRLRLTRNQINQSQALQATGNHRRAREILTAAIQTLQTEPDSLLKATGLRSLGNVLRVTGDLKGSQQELQQSLEITEKLSDSQTSSETLLSLGNTVRAISQAQRNMGDLKQAEQNFQQALESYQQAATKTNSPTTRIQAQLNQFSLLLEQNQWEKAIALQAQLPAELNNLPTSRATLYARVNYVKNLLRLNNQKIKPVKPDLLKNAAQIVATAIQQARSLKDSQAEAYALGLLGSIYEQTGQSTEAQMLTRKALLISHHQTAFDVAYQWQWQLGRLLWAQGDVEGAITAYREAIKLLKTLRSDLVAVNPDVQFSFREDVEPVYRQYVDLLLQPKEPSQDSLKAARQTIESLQLAELDNFLREACLQPRRPIDFVVDQERTAAAIYPIILPDRLEVILKLPNQSLQHHSIAIAQTEVEKTLDRLGQGVTRTSRQLDTQALAQQVYDWLIRPFEPTLANSQIKTLVFVLDGDLRSLPMAVLYDGNQYLVEKYSIALTPGLQLIDPKPLQEIQLQALVAGVSGAVMGLDPLPFVEKELQEIQSQVSSQVLLNQEFTTQRLQFQVNARPFSVIHLATHGEFSANPDQTFILAWDRKIKVNELNTLLRARDEQREEPIELLVLSACETAAGDRRAALGIAGIAVRAGARSTLASLWSVNDASTALLMGEFYRAIGDSQMTKAEALRQAQLMLLKDSYYGPRPYYWAPYILLGNWL
jgi:CHAT domain-containing protein